jgi:hypothetical protein
VSGSTYRRPVLSTDRVLDLDTAKLRLVGGNLSPGFTNAIALLARSKVENLGTNKLSLAISTSSGLFSGRVTHPNTGRSISFRGAVLQTQKIGAGFALGTNRSARVSLGR